jgi:hypothetical protein
MADADEDEVDLRLGELILYIAQRSTNDRWFGKVKLAKLLAFSDFYAFGRIGNPITGATYIKLPEGPVPERFYTTLGRLVDHGRAEIRPTRAPGDLIQERVIALDGPAPIFSDLELSFVKEMLSGLERYNAKELSDLAHRQFVGWQQAELRQPIPYATHHISPIAPTAAEIQRGLKLHAQAKRSD